MGYFGGNSFPARYPSLRRGRGVLIRLLAAACVLFAISVAGCRPHNGEEASSGAVEPREPRVRTVQLQPTEWSRSIRAYGVVEPAEEVEIGVDFSAKVRKVHFREGETVEAGQPLIEFDPRKRQLRLQESARTVDDARARLEEARETLNRRRGLFEKGLLSVEEFQTALADFRSAKARFEQSLAARSLAQREVEERRLPSPVSGKVAKRQVEEGETVMPGQVLAVLQTVDTVRVMAHVTEKEVNALRVGMEAEVTTPGVYNQVYQGRVEMVGIEADPRTGNFPIKLMVKNDDGLLRDGMTAQVSIRGLVYDDVLLVPRQALVDRRLRRVVYRLRGDTAEEVEPAFAVTMGDRLPVLDGLKAGDVLIVSGLDSVVDGSKVRVVEDGQ